MITHYMGISIGLLLAYRAYVNTEFDIIDVSLFSVGVLMLFAP